MTLKANPFHKLRVASVKTHGMVGTITIPIQSIYNLVSLPIALLSGPSLVLKLRS